jgi:uncharacterized protein YgbK (DUF1537 family)
MIIGVVADDVTGSNDIGVLFTKSGCPANVYNLPDNGNLSSITMREGPWEVGIINTNSRLDSAKAAYRKVFQATRYFEAQDCRRYFKKTCSVFRGNIGAEFDAMLDALCLEFGVVVLGFPKNGRTTRNGIHRVRGLPLEESEFQNDPIHPMRRSNLAEILRAQTRRKVGGIYHDIIERGPDAIREALESMRTRCGYVILDVIDQESLKIIAEAVRDEPVLCGSSALAEELPEIWGASPNKKRLTGLPKVENCGILCVAGSLMPQTRRQVQRYMENGAAAFELDVLGLFDEVQRDLLISELVPRISQVLATGQDSLLYSGANLERVDAARRTGRTRGLSDTDTGRLVSGALAEITKRVLKESGQNRLVVAGGETADAVCNRLGIKGLEIWEEIQPGLPSCLSIPESSGGQVWLLVLKSGSFGDDDFLVQALDHLRALD